MRHLILLLLLLPTVASAQWLHKSDSLTIEVPNVIVNGRQRVDLADFAVLAGKAYAKDIESNLEFMVIPVMATGVTLDETIHFFVVLDDERVEAVDAQWLDRPIYSTGISPVVQSLAVFPRFRLKDVTGFVIILNGKEYILCPNH